MNVSFFTLNIPVIDNVKLEVYVTTKYSLSSIAKAKNAPNETLNTYGSISLPGSNKTSTSRNPKTRFHKVFEIQSSNIPRLTFRNRDI